MVDFLVIGNGGLAGGVNSIFELFMLKKMKYGYSISSGDRYFEVPDDYDFYGIGCKEEEGKRYIAVSGVRWFTSMRDDYPPKLVLSRKYVEGEYKKFDNFDAINIDKTKDIPVDYDGLMGVPITFIDKWNPEQFELIGLFCDKRNGKYLINGDSRYIDEGHKSYVGPVIDGKAFFTRILIKKK